MGAPDWDGEAWGNVETVDGVACPIDPMDALNCDSCQ